MTPEERELEDHAYKATVELLRDISPRKWFNILDVLYPMEALSTRQAAFDEWIAKGIEIANRENRSAGRS